MAETPTHTRLRIVPANEAHWSDIQTVFGERGWPHDCQCQWFKLPAKQFEAAPWSELEQRQRELTHCGDTAATGTTGLVAFVDGEPAGWVAVEPRVSYLRMRTMRTPWLSRNEDKGDPDVWAITCFVTRTGFRNRGLMTELIHAAAAHAHAHGASAVEGYPLVLRPGERLGWGELYVGASSAFARAGFTEVSRPSERRAVMRLDF